MHLPVALSRPDAVSHPLGYEFALELRERKQDIEDHPAHTVGCIECLRDRNECDISAIEDLDQANEIGQTTCQPINLVNHNDINLASLDVLHEPSESRPLEPAARMAAIVVRSRQFDPALVLLAPNIGAADLARRDEGVNVVLEELIRAFASIDCAPAKGRNWSGRNCRSPDVATAFPITLVVWK